MPDEGKLVESGSFRVDREAALAKLAEHQLQDPTRFLLSWIRAGVARGAKKISVELQPSSLDAAFEGAVFSPEELEGVLEGVLAGDAGRKHLATGVLAAFKFSPRRVEVASGGPGEARSVAVGPDQTVAPSPATLKRRGTAISFVAGPKTRQSAMRSALDWVTRDCAACPAPISVFGVEVAKNPLPRLETDKSDGWLAVDDGGRRAWARPSPGALSRHQAAFSCFGVQAARLDLDAGLAGVEGMVRDDGLSLDISQAAVVKNERFEQAAALLDAAAAKLIDKLAPEASQSLSRRWKTIKDGEKGGGYPHWREMLEATHGPEPIPDWLGGGNLLSSLFSGGDFRLAREIAWLRAACLKLVGPEQDAGRPGAATLWNAPIFITHDGRLVSLAAVERVRARTGKVEVRPRLDANITALFQSRSHPCATVAEMAQLLQRDAGDLLSDEYSRAAC